MARGTRREDRSKRVRIKGTSRRANTWVSRRTFGKARWLRGCATNDRFGGKASHVICWAGKSIDTGKDVTATLCRVCRHRPAPLVKPAWPHPLLLALIRFAPRYGRLL